MKQFYLETERLLLRNWEKSDTAQFIEMNKSKEVMKYFPYTFDETQTLISLGRISNHFDKYSYGLFAVERKDNGVFIGFTGLSHPQFESSFTPCVEIGWRLNNNQWNFGFATEAAKACLQFGLNIINLAEIYAFTSIHNKASERVMQKIGMQQIKVFEHPLIVDGHYLKQHILYKISK